MARPTACAALALLVSAAVAPRVAVAQAGDAGRAGEAAQAGDAGRAGNGTSEVSDEAAPASDDAARVNHATAQPSHATAQADSETTLASDETWLINAHGTAARAATDADADPGGSLGIGVYRSLSPWIQVGGRLTGAVLPATALAGPEAAAQAREATDANDPLMLATFAAMLRVRPFADAFETRRGTGLYLEAGAGPALSGDRVTGAIDVGLGYTFAVTDALAIGPGVRYLHAFEGDSRTAGRDVQAMMLGIEITAFDAVRPAALAAAGASPETIAASPGARVEAAPTVIEATAIPPVSAVTATIDGDTDADGVADRFDRCPAAAETVNGINDHDGCPDDGSMALDDIASRVVVDELLFFDRGSEILTARGIGALDDIAAMYRDSGTRALILRGHIDTATDRHGAAIAAARAEAIKAALIARGVKAQAIFTEAYAIEPVVVAQADGDGQRVEFVFGE